MGKVGNSHEYICTVVPVTTLRKDPELEASSGQTLSIKESTDLEFAGKLQAFKKASSLMGLTHSHCLPYWWLGKY